MNIRNLIQDEDAVSPVIGVILMVAITVILAAVIGTFVLGLGGSTTSAPQASFTFDYAEPNTNLKITHDGGDSVTASQVSVAGANESDTWDTFGDSTSTSGEIRAGDNAVVDVTAGSNVRVTWAADSGDTTATLAEFEVPN